MASITFKTFYVNLLSTGASLSAWSEPTDINDESEGEIRVFASGRRRSISTVGDKRTWPITLRLLTEAQFQTLKSWKRQAIVARDYRGQIMYGTFFSLNKKPIGKQTPALYDVSFTLSEVDV